MLAEIAAHASRSGRTARFDDTPDTAKTDRTRRCCVVHRLRAVSPTPGLRCRASFLDRDPSRGVALGRPDCDRDGRDDLQDFADDDAVQPLPSAYERLPSTKPSSSDDLDRTQSRGRRCGDTPRSRFGAVTRPRRFPPLQKIGRGPAVMRSTNLHCPVAVGSSVSAWAGLFSLVRTDLLPSASLGAKFSALDGHDRRFRFPRFPTTIDIQRRFRSG